MLSVRIRLNFMRAMVFAVLTGLAAGFVVSGAARAEDCMTDWGAAGEIVRREKLITVQQLSQPGPSQIPGQIVKTTLCKDGDDYVYKVVIREAGGRLKTLVVDARRPASGAADGAPGNSR
ncbi:MAG: hypothetical protein ABL897_01235 [Hyphomicrobium sp.]